MDGIPTLDIWDLVVVRNYTRHLIRHTDFSVFSETPSLNKNVTETYECSEQDQNSEGTIGVIQCRSCLLKREFFSSRCHTLHF